MILSGDKKDGYWLLIPVNPEPWAVGPVQTGRRNGKVFANMGANAGLVAYQEAVREELEKDGVEELDAPRGVVLEVWFHRVLADYETASGKRHRKHQADGTNMLKAIEDAMQGILYKNDRDNAAGSWEIVELDDSDTGFSVVHVRPKYSFEGFIPYEIEIEVSQKLKSVNTGPSDLSWPPKDGEVPF